MNRNLLKAGPDKAWNGCGYVLWIVGSALFGVVAWRNGDTLSLIASTLFFVGILVVLVPLMRDES